MKTFPYFSPDEGSGSPSSDVGNQAPSQSTPAPTNSTSAPTPDSGGDWENKYKGLQKVVNKYHTDNEKLRGDLQIAQADLEQLKLDKAALEGQLNQAKSDYDSSKETAENTAKSLSAKDLEIARLKLLIDDFPGLASFEKKGVLPTADNVEELRTRFQSFQEAMKDIVKTGTQQALTNSAPPAPSGSASGPDISLESMQDQLNQLAGKPDKRQEYLRLRDQFDALWDARKNN
jgi:chromosome segregation ATPase